MSTEPRSIRLNKEHRADILNSVMQQWEKTNPAPVGSSFAEFVEAVLRKLMATKKNGPAELKALQNLSKRSADTKAFVGAAPTTVKEAINVETEEDFRIQLQLDTGETGSSFTFELPKTLADNLKISYFTTRVSGNLTLVNEWPQYAVQSESPHRDKELETVVMVNKSSWNTLVFPRNSPEYKVYKDSQRALELWRKDKEKARGEIKDYLDQFNTTGQIRDGWPEMTDYLPAHIADPARVIKLPAITRSRLNERLGIK